MDQARKAILATLAYSDIFDYPLTRAELWRYLVTEKPVSFSHFEKALASLDIVRQKENVFFLKGRNRLIEERQRRKKISQRKLRKAQDVAALLAHLPTIELIAVSGSLAMQNADKHADIDLFIVTKAQTLWVTRLMITAILQAKHLRRKRQTASAANSICVNMLIDTAHLAFPKNRQDSYTAHELLQMKPLFARGDAYHALLKKNKWIQRFLPNGFPASLVEKVPPLHPAAQRASFLESFARTLQMWYMRRHRTTETILAGFAAFHPYDYKGEVLAQWEKRKEKYAV